MRKGGGACLVQGAVEGLDVRHRLLRGGHAGLAVRPETKALRVGEERGGGDVGGDAEDARSVQHPVLQLRGQPGLEVLVACPDRDLQQAAWGEVRAVAVV